MPSADFTIADVLTWARTKPADEGYYYTQSDNCALCHFLRETGRSEKPRVSPYLSPNDTTAGWRHEGQDYSERRPYPYVMENALAVAETYGDLVERLEALCPDTPVNESNWQAIDAYLTDIEDVARERVLS